MQPIDPNTLFSIFEAGDEEIYQQHNVTGVLDNPFVLMGMVMRGIENYHLMDMMYMRQYPKQYKGVRKITKHKYFNKLYGYLTRIDLNKPSSVYQIGDSFNVESVNKCLEHLMFYFEDLEEYEKCAIIKKYLNLLQEEKQLI